MKNGLSRRLSVYLIIIFLLITASCTPPPTLLDTIRDRGEVRVVTIYSPTTYYIDTDSESGFEFELARLFAEFLNVDLKIVIAANKAEMIDILLKGEADVAAGLLKQTYTADNNLVSGPEYFSVNQQIIYKNGFDRPRNPGNLYPFQVHIPEGLIVMEKLLEMKQEHPDFSWKIHPDLSSADLVGMVEGEQIAYAVVYSNELSLAQQTYPELRSAFDISEPGPLSWYVKNSGDISLMAEINAFYGKINEGENLAEMIEHFYGPAKKFDYVDQLRFVERYSSRLPDYQTLFIAAGEQYDFDWRLLAAMSYQESHWNERARSPTGVRGLMMLTLTTARHVGIMNRLDPEQSIMGGAKYIRQLANAIPDRIQEPDKILFALAAYNVGFGHVEDARIITEKRGGNPDKWQDVRDSLPLLQKAEWYKQTMFGYARGSEAVSYVESIRKYYNTLVHLTRGEFPEPSPPEEPARILQIQTWAL